MSIRTTLALVVVLALLGVGVRFFGLGPKKESPPSAERGPFVYSVDFVDIEFITVKYEGKTVSLDWDSGQERWVHTDPTIGPLDQDKMNEIRLLLGGPGSTRVITGVDAKALAEFGLAPPQTEITLGLKSGADHKVFVGHQTPNGLNYYVQNAGYDPIFLVDISWGDEINRLVTDPPIAKPIPGAEYLEGGGQ